MTRGIAALRRFARGHRGAEHEVADGTTMCGLCGHPVGAAHAHLVEPRRRRLECACPACALLFDHHGRRFSRVPDRCEVVPMEAIVDAWERLALPIGLAFLMRWSIDDDAPRAIASSPGPLGVVDHPVDAAEYERVAASHPTLAALRPDLEALLVHRPSRRAFVVSVDRCFHLAGALRGHRVPEVTLDGWLDELGVVARSAVRS